MDLVNLHVVIHGQMGIANGRTWGRGWMAGADAELLARALDRIAVAIAAGAWHGQITGRREFVERGATAIQSDESTLGGGDLQQIRTNSGQGDGFGGSRTFVGGGHGLKIEMKSAIGHGGSEEKNGKPLHTAIFGPEPQLGQGKSSRTCRRKQHFFLCRGGHVESGQEVLRRN